MMTSASVTTINYAGNYLPNVQQFPPASKPSMTSTSSFVTSCQTLPTEAPLTTLNCSDIGIDVSNFRCESRSAESAVTVQNAAEAISVPFGWRRELSVGGRVVYYSPTNNSLRSLQEVSSYLQSEGTCKCGLECPLIIEKVFNFDARVVSKPYTVENALNDDSTKLCNQKRKIMAIATFQQHQKEHQHTQEQQAAREEPSTPLAESPAQVAAEPQPAKKELAEVEGNGVVLTTCATATSNTTSPLWRDSRTGEEFNAVSVISKPQTDLSFNGTICTDIKSTTSNSDNRIQQQIDRNISFLEQSSRVCHPQQNSYLPTHTNLSPRIEHHSIGSDSSQPVTIRLSVVGDSSSGNNIEQNVHSHPNHQAPTQAYNLHNHTSGHTYSIQESASGNVYSISCGDSNVHVGQDVSQEDHCPPIYFTQNASHSHISGLNQISSSYQVDHSAHLFHTPQQGSFATADQYHFNNQACANAAHNVLQTGVIQAAIPFMNGPQHMVPMNSHSATQNAANGNANGGISFHNAVNINQAYSTSSMQNQHPPTTSLSILPTNPPMPAMSVPNVTAVTSSVTDMIPAVGLSPQVMNSNPSTGASQVLQFINTMPITSISANGVTVLQSTSSNDTTGTTILIPQLMQSTDHQMLLSPATQVQAVTQQPMFSQIAAGMSTISGGFQGLSIAPHFALQQQRHCIQTNNVQGKARTRRRKDTRTSRPHPPTVASILRQAEAKEKIVQEMKKQLNALPNVDSEPVIDTKEEDTAVSLDSSRSVAVQSELNNDYDTPVNGSYSLPEQASPVSEENSPVPTAATTSDISCPVVSPLQVDNLNSAQENVLSDTSSENSDAQGPCSDSGVESEPTPTLIIEEGEEVTPNDGDSSQQQKNLRRLKRLRRELFYYGNGNSDDESPDSPPLPPQPRTFNIGDVVWGQIRGVASWPGQLVSGEEWSGHRINDGKLCVRWFGDHSITQVEPEKLKTLTEGLEAHHSATKKYRRGKRTNPHLDDAIQEAMIELDRQSERNMDREAALDASTCTS